MSHIHNSAGCDCCSAMGIKFDYAKQAADPQVVKQRLTTQGMEHIYLSSETVKVEVLEPTAEFESNEQAAGLGDIAALQSVMKEQLEQIEEQSLRLEAASYRIGYLEAQLQGKDEQLKLLTTDQVQIGWWQAVNNWFK
jgi:hypothetical protein